LAPFRELVGTATSDHQVFERSDVRSTLTAPYLFAEVEPESGFVPARITGRVTGEGVDTTDALAISINGVIRATTRVGPRGVEGAPAVWSALVDPATFRQGDNTVGVYGITAQSGGVALTALYSRDQMSESTHLALEASELGLGVEVSGFHPEQYLGDQLVRCTNGEGRLVVPTRGMNPPTALAVSIARGGVGFTRLEIRVDGCQILEERIPPERWSGTIPLGECAPKANPTIIEIVGDSFTLRDGSRTIGICLDGLRFVSDP
jgi:hypothetical protein